MTQKTYPPSIFNAYNICKRQAWLMVRQLNADQSNEFLEIGRLIDNESFKRQKKRIYIADLEALIDMIIKKDETTYIAEIKKSSKTLESGINQLKYYLYLIKVRKGINAKGIIKIPKERISREVILTEHDIEAIEKTLREMNRVLGSDKPPEIKNMMRICKVCAHFEFCWS